MGLQTVVFVTLLLITSVAEALSGQAPATEELRDRTVYVFGDVADQATGQPLASAYVVLRRSGETNELVWQGTADEEGRFQAGRLDLGSYEVRVEALGFAPLTHPLTFDRDGTAELQIQMSPEALQLEPIVVTATRDSRLETEGFFARRRAGLGTTLTRDEIEERGFTSRVSELLYGVAGVQVVPPRRVGGAGEIRLRQGCTPLFVINGRPLGPNIALDDVLSVQDVEAMEVYQGATAPVQYGGNGCGTVMAWTREYGTIDGGSSLSWRKLLGAVGVLGLMLWVSQ